MIMTEDDDPIICKHGVPLTLFWGISRQTESLTKAPNILHG